MIQDNTNTNLDYLDEPVVQDGVINKQGVFNVVLSFFNLVRCLYIETEDTTPVEGKTYFVKDGTQYSEADVSEGFEVGVTYYEKSREKEALLFNQYYEMARIYCCRITDWSFQISSKTYEEDDINNMDEVDSIDDIESGYFVEKRNNETEPYKIYKVYRNFKYQFKLPDDFLKIKYVNGNAKQGFAVKGNTFYCNSKSPTIDYVSSELTNIPIDFGYLIAYRTAIEMSTFLDADAMAKASNSFSIALQTLKANEDEAIRLANPPTDYFTSVNSDYWKRLGVIPK